MGIIHRVICFFYAIAVGILSAGAVAASMQVVPESVWTNELKYLFSQHEALTVSLIFVLISFYMILHSLFVKGSSSGSGQRVGDIVVSSSGVGEINVSSEAVKNLAEREAMSVSMVRDVRTRMQRIPKENGPFQVDVQLMVLTGANVAEISEQVIERIQSQIENTLGFQNIPVNVSVVDISNAPVGRRKRVV